MARVLSVLGCVLAVGCGRFGFEAAPADAAIDAGLGTLVGGPAIKISSPVTGDYFGYAVALTSDRQLLATSARWEDTSGEDAGALYVFARTETGWEQQAYLKAADPSAGAELGGRMAMTPDGSTLITSAWGDAGKTGAAYVFVRSGTTWRQQAKLRASDPTSGAYFASDVVISDDGNTTAIGAYNAEGGRGAAYVFERSGEVWTETARHVAPQGAVADAFGDAVALSGDGQVLAVGAPRDGTAGGIVYIFRRITGGWTLAQQLVAMDAHTNLVFGHQIALTTDGARMAITAAGHAQFAGAVDTFVHGPTGFSQETRLVPANSEPYDEAGWALAASPDGSVIVIGARGESSGGSDPADNSVSRAGAAYVFVRTGTGWMQHSYLKAPMPQQNDTFGHSLAVVGSTVVVGVPGESTGEIQSGAVFVFEAAP